MKTILILGALPKTSIEEERYEIMNFVANEFADVVYSPLDTKNFSGNDLESYERAFKLVQKADIVIAELTLPSTGQGMEIREAVTYNKPLFVLAKTDSHVSDLLKFCPVLKKLVFYNTEEELKLELRNLLEENKNLFYA